LHAEPEYPEREACQNQAMALLHDDALAALGTSHPDWTVDGASMSRTFTFSDFIGAMGFVTEIALLAEKAFHHPDIDIRWNQVTLVLSTHSEGGLTEQDLALASAIDGAHKSQP